VLKAGSWEEEVEELLSQIVPCATSDAAVNTLVQLVTDCLKEYLPDVEIAGFAFGDLARGKAFGVAVPNVELVVSVSLPALLRRMHGRAPRTATDAFKLHKAAIRAFTEHLVWGGGFKFRRSAFRSQDPKVTLVSPATIEGFDGGIPVDIYVNATTPLQHAFLVMETGSLELHAGYLMLLVRRWAKDRGVCHAAKGHLSPQAWNVLTIFFLQMVHQAETDGDRAPILPPLEDFPVTSGLASQGDLQAVPKLVNAIKNKGALAELSWMAGSGSAEGTDMGGSCGAVTGALLKDFFIFYAKHFDLCNEVVSIRRDGGQRSETVAVSVRECAGDCAEAWPIIEDPFNEHRNLCDSMTVPSLARLREELSRAAAICSVEEMTPSLVQLLEPWMPPHYGEEAGGAD
jgi:hypothetical protein